jgi:hypothetical protein
MRNILASLIIWLLAINCLGQELNRNNTLSLKWGPGFISRQDLIFSPFIHTDFSLTNFGVDYTREAKFYQKASLNYAGFNPMVSSPYKFTIYGETEEASTHHFTMIDLDYLIGKKFRETDKSTITAGGLFSADIQSMNYVYGRISSFGYYSAFSLGIFGRGKVLLNEKSSLSATIHLPLVAWLARSPYLVNDDEFIENISSHSSFNSFLAFIGDGELVTWNRLQAVDLEIKYTYRLSDRWELGAAYWFEFIHAGQPRNLLSYRNSLNLSVIYKF